MSNFIKDLGEFLWEVIFQWSNLYTGGVIVAFLGLYYVIAQKTVSRRVGVAVAVFFVIAAMFLAWREQLKAKLEQARQNELLQKKLEDLSNPHLSASIDSVATGEITGHYSGPLIIIQAVITNSIGAPSSLKNWKIHLEFDDGRKIEGTPPFLSVNQQPMTQLGKSNFSMDISRERYLPFMTQSAIKPGDTVSGWIWALFRSLNLDEAYQHKAMVVIEFDDVVTSKTHEFRGTLGSKGIPPDLR